jgi:exonuclease SbcC
MNLESSKLEELLSRTLERKDPRIESLPDVRRPLFLLVDVAPDLVGFADIDGKPEEDYRRALEGFQSLYADFADKFPEHDLTLVLCTHDSDPSRSAYWNEVELDRYFCRKFVIDMNQSLGEQIRRLPFVPLNPEVVGLARPLSAQTLLIKKHHLTLSLAQSLAVPGRSPETIVNRCLKGEMGEPTLKKLPIDAFVSPPAALRPKVRLKELHIENFRAYKSQTLHFDHDVIVLYGPNGLGKTSLFDALDFVCTGGVLRFDERFGREKGAPLIEVLTHIGTSPSQALVKATMTTEGTTFKLERRVSDAKKGRRKTLAKLAGISDASKVDLRIENFVRLFRSSHFFGQDSASLTSDVRDNSVLPEETVSRMLAFQDYVEALNKSKKIVGELNARATDQEEECGRILSAITAKEIERTSLQQIHAALDTPEFVLTKGRDLARRIVRFGQLEIEVPPEIDSSAVQAWRSSLEAELHRVATLLERVTSAQGKLTERESLQRNTEDLSGAVESTTRQASELQQSQLANKERLAELGRKRDQVIHEEQKLLASSNSLRWLLDTLPRYQRQRTELSTKQNDLQRARLDLSQAEAALEKVASERELIDDRIGQLQREIQSDEADLSQLRSFLSTVDDWRRTLEEQEKLGQLVEAKQRESVAVSREVQANRSELAAARAARQNSERFVTQLQRTQSELQNLLDSIIPHVTSEICPVCGTPHQSRDALLQKIKDMRGVQSDAHTSALAALDRARTEVDRWQEVVETGDRVFVSLTDDLDNLKQELNNINARATEHIETALALPVASQATPDSSEAAARLRESELSNLLAKKREGLSAQFSDAQTLPQRIDTDSERRRGLSAQVSDLESHQTILAEQLTTLQRQATEQGVDLEQEPESAQHEIEAIAGELGGIKVTKHDAIDEFESLRERIDNTERELAHLDEELRQTQMDLTKSHHTLQEIKNVLTAAGLEPDAPIRDVATFRDNLDSRRATLSDLRDQVTDFEVALDAAQTHAALARLQSDIDGLQTSKEDADNRLRSLRTWRHYFEQILEALRRVQDELLTEYIEKYGPLASIIQQRLRPVYGFKGVKLKTKKGKINVTVEREGHEYPPSNYFSESQLQIVTLSLFLSAVLTQTWSSFGLVLLDDPVTHFDDLNAYAFLDVLRGLIDQPGQGHQFIISTCEERLYRLMRQRLPKAKGSVAFYEFISIGEGGPVVREA